MYKFWYNYFYLVLFPFCHELYKSHIQNTHVYPYIFNAAKLDYVSVSFARNVDKWNVNVALKEPFDRYKVLWGNIRVIWFISCISLTHSYPYITHSEHQ